jgi:hypothetical protein
MSDDPKNDKALGRRETLRLATAVSALGLGLGATLIGRDAEALPAAQQKIAVNAGDLGRLQLKLWKIADGQPPQLLHTLDATALATAGGGVAPGTYNLKLTSIKSNAETTISDQLITITQQKN